MIYLFVPYYNNDSEGFKQSLAEQVYKDIKIIRRDRKRDKVYWTRACNDFYKDLKRYRGVKDDDVIGIMNNDVSFTPGYLLVAARVKKGQVFTCDGITIDWSKKKFTKGTPIHTFPGRAFFMTAKDFKASGGFCKLLPRG